MDSGRQIATFITVYMLLGIMTSALVVIDAIRSPTFQKRLDEYYESYKKQGYSHLHAEFRVCLLCAFGVCYSFIFWAEQWKAWIEESWFDERD